MNFDLKTAFKAHKFHPEASPNPLAVRSAKASCNGAMLIPHSKVLGYDQTVWGVQTARGPMEVREGDWIVEHSTFGVFVMTPTEFDATFAVPH